MPQTPANNDNDVIRDSNSPQTINDLFKDMDFMKQDSNPSSPSYNQQSLNNINHSVSTAGNKLSVSPKFQVESLNNISHSESDNGLGLTNQQSDAGLGLTNM